MLMRMLLIVAALEEELRTAMDACQNLNRIQGSGIHLWQGKSDGSVFCFLKAGIGPSKSAASLDRALEYVRPEQILMTGYAGALDPDIKLGTLVAGTQAMLFSLDDRNPDWQHVRLDGSFELIGAELLQRSAISCGLNAVAGSVFTSPYVLGDPAHKNVIFQMHRASIVDMETAAIARIAAARRIPMSCIRAVSDEAADTFLMPFSHNPSIGMTARAKKLLNNGMTKTYREWKDHAAKAKSSLSRFFASYL